MALKHLYYSDLLDQEFESEEAALAAEKEYEDEQAKKEAAAAARKERADKIKEAYEFAQHAYDEYETLVKEFIKDYGSYHCSYVSSTPIRSVWDWLREMV